MREAPCRHRDGDGAQQQADHRGQRQEALGPVSRGVSALATLLGAAQPHRIRQFILDRVVECADRVFITGDQQRITDAAADADQCRRLEVGRIHQQGWGERRETDRLVGTVGDHRGDAQFALADREAVADVGADPGQQCAVRPHLAGFGYAPGLALLAEQRVGDSHRTAQRILGGNG